MGMRIDISGSLESPGTSSVPAVRCPWFACLSNAGVQPRRWSRHVGGSELPHLLDINRTHHCRAAACCLPQQLPPQEGAAPAAAVLG